MAVDRTLRSLRSETRSCNSRRTVPSCSDVCNSSCSVSCDSSWTAWTRSLCVAAWYWIRSGFQSRASVWRWPVLLLLLAAAVAAFVWLPDEVRQQAVQQVTSIAERSGLMPAPAAAPPAPADLKSLAEQKLAAEQVRDRATSLQATLRGNGAAARTLASFVAGGEALQQGLGAFERRDFKSAQTDFSRALQSFQATQQALPELHRRALADGDAALAQCLSTQALNEYRYALALSPNDAAAQEGIARAQVCEQVFAHVSAGAKAEQAGDTPGAIREYKDALQLDPKSPSARTALAALTGQADEAQFGRQLAAALALPMEFAPHR